MSKTSTLRKLKVKKEVKYPYLIKLDILPKDGPMSKQRNKTETEEIRTLLMQSGKGAFKFKKNKKGYVNQVLLKEKSDVMLIKMCFSKYIFKFYELSQEL